MTSGFENFNPRALFERNLNGAQRNSLLIGIIGMALLVFGLVVNRAQFFECYLEGFVFWGGMGFGFLLLLILHNATGGRWGLAIRPYLEAGSRTVQIMWIFFIPIVLGIPILYAWTRPEVQADLEGWATKSHYLNVSAWIFRAVLYFAIWIFYSMVCKAWNTPRKRRGQEEHGRLTTICCLGLLIFFITMSFAAIDWVMSVEPQWFSSIFGVIIIVGQGWSAFAFMVLFTAWIGGDRKAEIIPVKGLADLGNFMLMAVMLWAYTSFSQYLLIWSAQLPNETEWLIRRSHGGWGWIGFFLIMIHFFLPFFLLLFRKITRNHNRLAFVAVIMLLIHMVHDIWLIGPAFRENVGFPFVWMNAASMIGFGGIWIAIFIGYLKAVAPVELEHEPHPVTSGPVDRPHTARRPGLNPVGA